MNDLQNEKSDRLKMDGLEHGLVNVAMAVELSVPSSDRQTRAGRSVEMAATSSSQLAN